MIIGFSGSMGSGKSTAIETLVFNTLDTPHKVRLVKFAQPLYDMQEFIYRRVEAAYDRPHGFVKDRKLLQWLGKEWGRDSISPTIWIDLWKEEALRLEKQGYVVVCDDVRFDNEADAIRALGGKIVKINSKLVYSKGRISTADGLVNHASESGICASRIDHIVENNKTLAEYHGSLLKLYKKLLWPIKAQKKGRKA